MDYKILAIDDDIKVLTSLELILHEQGFNVSITTNPFECLKILEEQEIDILIMDLKMPGMCGSELAEQALKVRPDIIILVLTGFGSIRSSVELMKKGVFDYITKPYNVDELILIINRAVKHRQLTTENQLLKKRIKHSSSYCNIIGTSDEMVKVFQQIEKFSKVDVNVLILGESGTGKELVARALHQKSPRSNLSFVTADCGAITGSLLENEIFGHVKGAYTNAADDKKGYIEVAGEGTIFFDEIGELDIDLQKKILRLIEYKQYSKLGSTHCLTTNARVIAATNKDLDTEIENKRFREDLYFRLKVAVIQLPPLRDRKSDIPTLCEFFANQFNEKYNKKVSQIRSGAMRMLMDYDWPGNVRQLKNILETAWITKENNVLGEEDFPDELGMPIQIENMSFQTAKADVVSHFEKEYLSKLLTFCKGNVKKASELAAVERRNFIKLLNRNNIDPNHYKNNFNHKIDLCNIQNIE
jgi:DNA-binding NtrC family response regulator